MNIFGTMSLVQLAAVAILSGTVHVLHSQENSLMA